MSVYKAINKVQAALAKTGITKDRTNTQGSGYKFRGIDDVYNTIAPLLSEHGLCILPRVLTRHCDERLSKAGGALFYVTVEVEFDFVASEDGSKHTCKTFGEAMDSGDKATNKAMSAAYKYACFQAFSIPTESDNDPDAQSHEVKPKSTPGQVWETMTPAKQNELQGVADTVRSLFETDRLAALGCLGDVEDADEKVALWSRFDPKERSLIKKASQKETA